MQWWIIMNAAITRDSSIITKWNEALNPSHMTVSSFVLKWDWQHFKWCHVCIYKVIDSPNISTVWQTRTIWMIHCILDVFIFRLWENNSLSIIHVCVYPCLYLCLCDSVARQSQFPLQTVWPPPSHQPVLHRERLGPVGDGGAHRGVRSVRSIQTATQSHPCHW